MENTLLSKNNDQISLKDKITNPKSLNENKNTQLPLEILIDKPPNKNSENTDDSILMSELETGLQKNDIKFPTFEDPSINSTSLRNINYKETEEILNYLITSLDLLEIKFLEMIEIKKEIVDPLFNFYSSSKYSAKIYILGLKRISLLAIYILKIKFHPIDKKEIEKLIKEEFLISDEFFINNMLNYGDLKEIAKIDNQKFSEFIENFKILKTNEDKLSYFFKSEEKVPSLTSIFFTVKVITLYIESTLKDCENIMIESKEENVVDLLLNLDRIKIFNKILPLSFNVPSDDLFNLGENSETWTKLKKNTSRLIKHSKYAMKKKLQKLFDLVSVGSASISTGNTYRDDIMKFIGTGFFLAFYFFNKKEAAKETKKSFLTSNFDLSRKVWNLLDTTGIKSGYNGVLNAITKIKFRQKLYFKKTVKTIDAVYVTRLNEEIKYGFVDREKEENFNNPNLIEESEENKKELFLIEEYVKVKLLHSSDWHIPRLNNKMSFFSCCSEIRNFTRNSLIFHCHGGGFVAMSSSSHENYLRKWSNSLNVPIISVDYRLSPEYPFPAAIDDVWQAYNWVLKYAESELQIELNNIIVIGDSAGGNLILNLIYLCIINNKKLPKAVFLAYPALRIDDEYLSPSYLLSLKDMILPYHLLNFCLVAYKGEFKNRDNLFLSPILANNILLRMFPPVRILTGSADPLRDDNYRFLKKLLDSNIDAKLVELKYFPHGFLSYDLPMMLPEASVANDYLILEMSKFLDNENL